MIKMVDKIIKKDENGKDAVYERGIFGDIKIGTLKPKLTMEGGKVGWYTYNIGGNVEVGQEEPFSKTRPGSVYGIEGKFEETHPAFSAHERNILTFEPGDSSDAPKTPYDIDIRSREWESSRSGASSSNYTPQSALGKALSAGFSVLATGAAVVGAILLGVNIYSKFVPENSSSYGGRYTGTSSVEAYEATPPKIIEREQEKIYYERDSNGTIVLRNSENGVMYDPKVEQIVEPKTSEERLKNQFIFKNTLYTLAGSKGLVKLASYNNDLEDLIKEYSSRYNNYVGNCLSKDYLKDEDNNVYLLSCDQASRIDQYPSDEANFNLYMTSGKIMLKFGTTGEKGIIHVKKVDGYK